MNYEQISPTFRQALGCHEGFRKLGFASDDIFVHWNPTGEMLVVLKIEEKQFRVTVGCMDGASRDEWERLWNATVEAVREGVVSQPTMDRVWQESLAFNHGHDFVAGILHKGIKIPNIQARLQ